MADFFERTKFLHEMVGTGNLTGTFRVNGGGRTIPLEVGYWKNHMGRNGYVPIRNYNDGQPHAIQNSLEATYRYSLEGIASTTLFIGPQHIMKRHVEEMDAQFKIRAPMRTGQYRDSTARIVTDNGVPIHERYGAHYGEDPGA